MTPRDFTELRLAREAASFITCVGLDPDPKKTPKIFTDEEANMFAFLRGIIEATCDLAGSYKPNLKFFQKYPSALRRLVQMINQIAPGVPVIGDSKSADIGNTSIQDASFLFDFLGLDAVTIHGWMGRTAMESFLYERRKGVFVVCRTSNPDANEFQLRIDQETGLPMFAYMAARVANHWNHFGNCGIVVGGTCKPEEIKLARSMIPDTMPVLMPGFGSQGGDLASTLTIGMNNSGDGVLPVNASAIIHASSDSVLYGDWARVVLLKFNEDIARIRGR